MVDLQHAARFWQGKTCVILGLGISNRALLHALLPKVREDGLQLMVADQKDFDPAEVKDRLIQQFNLGDLAPVLDEVRWIGGPEYLSVLEKVAQKTSPSEVLIFRTPFLRPDQAELVEARKKGMVVTSEMELFCHLCPCPILAVTGSDGKTTTTTLTAKLLEKLGFTVHLGGNIGTPLIDRLGEIRSEDLVVLELSSFQLMAFQAQIDYALLTNISPNHLDYHKDFHEYKRAKANIFAHSAFPTVVINGASYDPEWLTLNPTAHWLFLHQAPQIFQGPLWQIAADGSLGPVDRDVEPVDLNRKLVNQDGKSLDQALPAPTSEKPFLTTKDIRLRGRFNQDNYLAALALVHEVYQELGPGSEEDRNRALAEAAKDLAQTFGGVAHRQALVREEGGVAIYESSIDSSPTRTLNTILAFRGSGGGEQAGPKPILIMGGKDKNCDYHDLARLMVKETKAAFISGQNEGLLQAALEEALKEALEAPGFSYTLCKDYKEALEKAMALAEPGDNILFTPAGTSFDHFKNFEERGEYFTELVRKFDK